ncbi:D-aminoacyl-tRNA deacylase [Panicum miliaceum]|uniref:D-aminoacyl-tRNA deacylase n=1 Tax=Panicum miliaceum TaxID=4540 RepID=A0A3L6PC88_PANMI|nr:D-aminoacyl-tRNA deacylase [Panicum miliaceum]
MAYPKIRPTPDHPESTCCAPAPVSLSRHHAGRPRWSDLRSRSSRGYRLRWFAPTPSPQLCRSWLATSRIRRGRPLLAPVAWPAYRLPQPAMPPAPARPQTGSGGFASCPARLPPARAQPLTSQIKGCYLRKRNDEDDVWVGHLLSGYSLSACQWTHQVDGKTSGEIAGMWKHSIKVSYEATNATFPGGEVIAHLDHK